MKTVSKLMIAVVMFAAASVAQAAPLVAYPSMSISELSATSESSYTSYSGLLLDAGVLYYGNFDEVRSYDLNASSDSKWAECGSNAGIGTINKLGTDVYMSQDTSYRAPYPSDLGTIVPVNGFQATMSSGTGIGETTYSIYDSAVHGGSLYFVANVGTYVDDGQDGQTGQTQGTSIFRYEAGDPMNPVEIATIGGASGGLTFDSDGNLYYASQNASEGVLKFTASQVTSGGLTAADGQTVVDITGGSLGFLSDGSLLAETGWGQTLAAYDPAGGQKLYDIATTTGSDYMGKFVVGADDTIYVLSNDWSTIYDYGVGGGGGAVLSAIMVPEPATVGLLTVGGGLALLRRRRR